jgi:alpha-N-arabinofuranosidase
MALTLTLELARGRELTPRSAFLLHVFVIGLVFAGMASAVPAWAGDKVQLSVDASRPGAKIDRNIFGQFAEHLGHGVYEGVWVGPESAIPNTRGIRNDVVAALKSLRVPNVRWPGGCFADEYHWRKGIGPAGQRAISLNPNWGGVTEPNTFGTHEFMDFIDQIGSESYLSVNVGSGTPQEASEWLEYMTTAQPTTLAKERAANGHPAPYKVAYLGIGNESWDCGGNMTADYYLSQMKIYSRFVRNFNPAQQENQQMLKIAVGPGGDGPRWTEWTETVMKAHQDHSWSWDINGLSMHSYTVNWENKFASVGFGEKEYAQVLKATLEIDGLISKHSAIMDKYDPRKKVALVVDEWGAWYAPLPGTNPGFLVQQNSQRDAILAALNLNIFARHADRVRMANIAQMVNVLQAMILTDNAKMVLTPTYYVFRMYVPFQDATFVPVTFDAGTYTNGNVTLPRVDAIAAKDKTGKLWLAITNLDPGQPVEIEADLAGITAKSAAGETLTAPKVDSVNTFDTPNTVVPKPVSAKVQGGRLALRLEPKSVTVVSIEQ